MNKPLLKYERPLVALALVTIFLCGGVAGATEREGVIPLAVVNDDTLTSVELMIELRGMVNTATEGAAPTKPKPERALRRLIQNQLVIQEGYRMGLDEDFIVRNQLSETRRNLSLKALLDSVTFSIQDEDLEPADLLEVRRAHMEDYLTSLRTKYDVVVDSLLLNSLDYASADAEIKKYLRESEDVLASLPDRDLTVAGLSRSIRFLAFHGLEGKPDAGARRDRIFWEWLNEALVSLEARSLGIHQRPGIEVLIQRLQRKVMLEEALAILLKFDFEPSAEEVEAYYKAHLDAVTPAPRIRMESLKFNTEQDAKTAHDKALDGAKLSWLAKNLPGVIEGPPPFPEDFFAPEKLGLEPELAREGYVPEPYGVPGGWVVAVVDKVERVEPIPLDQCRTTILRLMRQEATRQHMQDILVRLEDASQITMLPDAEATVARIIAETDFTSSEAPATP